MIKVIKNTHGEPFVWLTAMGLSAGLMMIGALLLVVLVNGIAVFWPKQVVRYTLKDASAAALLGSSTLAGEITKEQHKISQADPAGAGLARESAKEWQLYVGNKDSYGLAFRFVDERDILTRDVPKDILSVERIEHGRLFGYAQELRKGTKTLARAGDPDFDPMLKKSVAEAAARRDQIKFIEKNQIGRINARMQGARAEPDVSSQAETLQAEYEVLAQQARQLRALQNEKTLLLKLPTGGQKMIALGDILHIYAPNRLTWTGRARLFVVNIYRFLSEDPREANTEGGIFPAIFGTFVMTVLMSLAVTPVGVLAAIYLREYAKQGIFVRAVRIAVNNLAGVPSIVFGVFGLGFFVYGLGASIDHLFFRQALPTPTFGTGGLLWASLTLALMTVPVVIVATEESLAAVPRGAREGSLACGASKWQTIQRVVLPAAAPGIVTGFVLAMARGAGEVAPLMLVGVVKLAPTLPLDGIFPFIHLERKFMHLGFHIYDLGFQSPDSEAAKPMVFATTLVLLGLVLLLNIAAIHVRQTLRRKYATQAV